MNPILKPQDGVFWYLKQKAPNQLRRQLKTDVVVVGGGMAGLSAAQSFVQKGYSVVLLEKYFCGAGATGKSSGFITPSSELGLAQFKKKFGNNDAKKLWEFVTGGVQLIKENVEQYQISCDYQPEDTLVVANSTRAFSQILAEHEARTALSYESNLYNEQELKTVLKGNDYYGGVRYGKTFGINAYAYCQAMKEMLENMGVSIYEETPALAINARGVETPQGRVSAKHIIACIDRDAPELQKKLNTRVYHVQTFLMISAPLSNKEVANIFPEEKLMVWDTDLVYQYYRLTSDNRFMVGGSDLFSTLWGSERHNYPAIKRKLTRYVEKHFPKVTFNFEYIWPGLIGVSKDLVPIAGSYPDQPNVYYISCATGLPWAAALGRYSAQRIVEGNTEFDEYFSFDRKFPINNFATSVLGKRITFGLSNLLSLYGY